RRAPRRRLRPRGDPPALGHGRPRLPCAARGRGATPAADRVLARRRARGGRGAADGALRLVAEILDRLAALGARMPERNPAAPAQHQLLAPQHDLEVALSRDEGAVAAVVLQHPLVLPPLDRAVPPRGEAVGDRQAAAGLAPERDRLVLAAAHGLLAEVFQAQQPGGARPRPEAAELSALTAREPQYLAQHDAFGLALHLDRVELAREHAVRRVEELRGLLRGDDLPLDRLLDQARGEVHGVAEHVLAALDHRPGLQPDAQPELAPADRR